METQSDISKISRPAPWRGWVLVRRLSQIFFLLLFVLLFLKTAYTGQEMVALADGSVFRFRSPDPGSPPVKPWSDGVETFIIPDPCGAHPCPGPLFLRLDLSSGHYLGRLPAPALQPPPGPGLCPGTAAGEILFSLLPFNCGPVFSQPGGTVRPLVPPLPDPGFDGLSGAVLWFGRNIHQSI